MSESLVGLFFAKEKGEKIFVKDVQLGDEKHFDESAHDFSLRLALVDVLLVKNEQADLVF